MWIFLVFVAALPIFLLLPLQVRFSARLSAGVSHIRLETRVLGLFPLSRTLRLHLLSEPYLTLLLFKKHGGFRRIRLVGRKSRKKIDFRRFLQLKHVHATYYVGVPDDAAAAAMLCGAVSTAGEIALSRLFARVGTTALPVFDRAMLRINLEGIARLVPAKSIRILLHKK